MIWKTSEKKMKQKYKKQWKLLQKARKAEDRISELADEMEIQGKIEELLVKQPKNCERNMQELTNSTKRPNLRIMGIEE
jgi:hypothetical protein